MKTSILMSVAHVVFFSWNRTPGISNCVEKILGRHCRSLASLALATLTIVVTASQPATGALINGDFSAGSDAATPPGWSVIMGTNGENAQKREADLGGLSPQDGVSGTNGYALFTGNGGTGVYDGAFMSQAVSVTPNALHTLNFYLGKSTSLTTTFNVTVTQSVTGDLLDEDILATIEDGWAFYTRDFTPTTGSITIAFEDVSVSSASNAAGVDTVSLTFVPPSVPEPSSFLLLGLGAIGLMRHTRRRRRRA